MVGAGERRGEVAKVVSAGPVGASQGWEMIAVMSRSLLNSDCGSRVVSSSMPNMYVEANADKMLCRTEPKSSSEDGQREGNQGGYAGVRGGESRRPKRVAVPLLHLLSLRPPK